MNGSNTEEYHQGIPPKICGRNLMARMKNGETRVIKYSIPHDMYLFTDLDVRNHNICCHTEDIVSWKFSND